MPENGDDFASRLSKLAASAKGEESLKSDAAVEFFHEWGQLYNEILDPAMKEVVAAFKDHRDLNFSYDDGYGNELRLTAEKPAREFTLRYTPEFTRRIVTVESDLGRRSRNYTIKTLREEGPTEPILAFVESAKKA